MAPADGVALAAAERLVAAQRAALAAVAPGDPLPVDVLALLTTAPAPVDLGDAPDPATLVRAARVRSDLAALQADLELRMAAVARRVMAVRRARRPAVIAASRLDARA